MANKSKKPLMTLRMFSKELATVPTVTAWYLADLGEARGKQQLFVRQSPQRLKVLREHALIESAVWHSCKVSSPPTVSKASR